MKLSLFYVSVILAIILVEYFFQNRKVEADKFAFFSMDHTTVFRGIAALMVMTQHVTNHYGIRYFTPLGGAGVAIFLISSGYGLHESYLRKQETGANVTWGGVLDS